MPSREDTWPGDPRRRFIRHDAHLWIRHDAYRFAPRDAPQSIGRDAVRHFGPERERGECLAGADIRIDLHAVRERLLRLKFEVTALRAELKLRRALRAIKANFNPDQPRAPAGNPDGGQWASEGGAPGSRAQSSRAPTDISSSRRGRARGHHWMPRAIAGKYPFSDETRRVFDSATSGPIGFRATSESGALLGHYWDGSNGAHKAYSDAVDSLLKDYMSSQNILPEQMTADQARSFLLEIELSQDPRIRDYNNTIRLLRFLRTLRVGRGTE